VLFYPRDASKLSSCVCPSVTSRCSVARLSYWASSCTFAVLQRVRAGFVSNSWSLSCRVTRSHGVEVELQITVKLSLEVAPTTLPQTEHDKHRKYCIHWTSTQEPKKVSNLQCWESEVWCKTSIAVQEELMTIAWRENAKPESGRHEHMQARTLSVLLKMYST